MILSGPDILSRGFVYMRESGDLIRQSQRILFNAIRIALKNKDASVQSVNGAIVNAIRPFLYENTEREPIIIPDDPHTRWRIKQENSPEDGAVFLYCFLLRLKLNKNRIRLEG